MKRWLTLLAATGLVTSLATVTAPAAAGVDTPPPTTGSITLAVKSARDLTGVVAKGDPITTYKWLINEDATGNPGTINNQGLANCLPSGATEGVGSQVRAARAKVLKESNLMHSINGYVFGSEPMITMERGQHVR